MTPKEKAQELVDKFSSIIVGATTEENGQQFPDGMGKANRIKCALRCVDEIMKALNIPQWDGDPEHSPKDLGDGLYWQEVKTEIEKL